MSIPAFTLVQGLVTGLGYGLLALGLVLIYRTSRVLNFAHGQLGVLSAILLSKLVIDNHVPYGFALVIALAVAALVGAGSELVLRRLFTRPRVIVMVATIGLAQVLYLLTLVPIVRPKKLFASYPVPFHFTFSISTQFFQAGDVVTLIVAPLIAVALAVFFARSQTGLNMRAIAENSESARLAGIRVRRTSTLAWVLAAVLSAATAILASPAKANSFTQALGPELLLRGLAAALIASMTSLPVAFVAGVAIGIFEQVVSWNYPNTANLETVMFAVLLAVLVIGVRRLRRGPRDEERSSWRLTTETQRTTPDPRLGRATWVIAAAAALILPLLVDNSRNFLISRIYVYALVALSLTVLTGWAGQVSLGNFGLVAVGAIVAARMLPHQSIVLALVVAGLVGAAVAVVIGLPALRIRGLYLAVTTLGFALFMNVAVLPTSCWRAPGVGWHVCTGLPDPESTLIQRPSIFGISLHSQRATDYFVLVVLALAVIAVRIWRDRGVARGLIAVRDNEIGAAAMGSRVIIHKLTAFALSGALAGVAGVCFALVTERFTAVTFAPSLSLLVVAMVVIGGLGSVEGALLGAAYLIGIPAAFGSGPTVQFITSGVGLLVFLLYLPEGLAGILQRIGGRLTALAAETAPARDTAGAAGTATGRADTADTTAAADTGAATAAPVGKATATGAATAPAPRVRATAGTHRGVALALDGVTVDFGGLRAVAGVTFTAEPGEMIGIIGPNGSGKTTLLDAVSGLVPLANGAVAMDGEDLVDYLTADRAWLGLTRSFQDCRLYPELTVAQTLLVSEDARRPVRIGATTLQLPPARRAEREKREAVAELLATLHLERFRDTLISELSTGTRRVVDLATVLAAEPRVLLLDEPTAGLAQREAEAFGPLLREIRAMTGATVLIVEHDVPLTMSLCDRIVVMETGQVVSVGTPAQVAADPAAIDAYLGAATSTSTGTAANTSTGAAAGAARGRPKQRKMATR